jgi:hypothetical protein
MNAELIETGDICLVRHLGTHQSWAHRAILATTGAKHDHDELVTVRFDTPWTLYARPPQCGFIELEERREQRRRGEIVYAVLRISAWDYQPGDVRREWDMWQARVQAQCDLIAELRIPYDLRAIVRQGRNWLRSKVPILKPLVAGQEHRMYCTESVERITRIAGLSAFRPLPPQDFYSPIHTERAWLAGHLRLIEDGGLAEYVLAGRSTVN